MAQGWIKQTGLLASTLASLAPTLALATDNCLEDAMIVFDGSGSMAEMGFNLLDEPRIHEARRAIREAVPQIAPVRKLGLIIYGPGGPDSCSGIDLRFGPLANADGPIISAVEDLEPGGMTPLTESVLAAAETLNFKERPGVIVLVTDGKETCGGTPCHLGDRLMREGTDLTVHVIGFKVRGDHFAWDSPEHGTIVGETTVAKCLSDRTGGKYVGAETVNELVQALTNTLGCAVIGSLPLQTNRHRL